MSRARKLLGAIIIHNPILTEFRTHWELNPDSRESICKEWMDDLERHSYGNPIRDQNHAHRVISRLLVLLSA